MISKVLGIEIKPVGISQQAITVTLMGHPTEMINHAHRVVREIVDGCRQWRITGIEYDPPEMTQLASDGKMVVRVVAR